MGFATTILMRLRQPVRFVLAGAVGTLLYYIVLISLTEFFAVWYLLSATTASILNFASNFTLQRLWAFENRQWHGVGKQAALYVVLAVSLYTLNIVLLYLLVEYAQLWYVLAQVLVTGILSLISYFVTKAIVTN